METDPILKKINRLAAAVGAAKVPDLSTVPKNFVRVDGAESIEYSVYLDTTGGLSDADIENIAWTLVRSIADLKDHLKAFATRKGFDKEAIELAIEGNADLQMIIDLANYDKHARHSRDGGRSGLHPDLVNVKRVIRFPPGARLEIKMSSEGAMLQPFDGTALVVDGDVVDKNGNIIRTLTNLQEGAVGALETVALGWGLALTS